MKLDLTLEDGTRLTIREWPKGHRLFSCGDLHMSFDPPVTAGENPAILLKLEHNRCHILAVEAFDNDQAALAWFMEERRRLAN